MNKRVKTEHLEGQTDLEIEVKAREAFEAYDGAGRTMYGNGEWDKQPTKVKDVWRRRVNNQTVARHEIESSSYHHGRFDGVLSAGVMAKPDAYAFDLGSVSGDRSAEVTMTRDDGGTLTLTGMDIREPTQEEAEWARDYRRGKGMDGFSRPMPATAMKADSGKTDYTLIPWRIVARGPNLALIEPLERWWLKQISAGEAIEAARIAWAQIGRSYEADLAAVLNFGARKYAAWNWTLGWSMSRGYAGACRHFVAIESGEVLDPESGLDHRCHLAFYYAAIHCAAPDDRPGLPKGSRY